LPVKTS